MNTAAFALAAYVAILFGIAAYGDARSVVFDRKRSVRVWLLVLSLGVYCTSWTFYGAVGEAVRNGWDYLPIYLGPALVFLLGAPVVRRLVSLGRRLNTGSISDFLSARYGKSASVAAIAAAILALSALPYIGLQLRSAQASLSLLMPQIERQDWGVVLVLAFSGFAMLFGARQADTQKGNRGLVLALGLESIIKLGAMLAIGVFALGLWSDLPAAARESLWSESVLARPELDLRFFTLTLLAAAAILCLPRQFHVMVVEAREPGDVRPARWLFPAYLGLIALAAPPVALAGQALLSGVNPDAYILALPVSEGESLLAILAFLGGFSASAGMITVAALAVSIMLVDAILAPLALRAGLSPQGSGLAGRFLNIRRAMIVLLIFGAWLFNLGLSPSLALADIGLVSFAGAAQLAPSLLFGLFWRRANRAGAMAGMLAGGLSWLGLVVVPAYTGWSYVLPFGVDPFSSAALTSLAINVTAFIFGVAFMPATLTDRLQADRFQTEDHEHWAPDGHRVRLSDVETIFRRVLGDDETWIALGELRRLAGRPLSALDLLETREVGWCEARLARAVGAVAARILMSQVLAGSQVSAADVVTLLDEASEKIRTSETARVETQRSAQFYMDHVPALITYSDQDEHLLFANRAYLRFFGLSERAIGRTIAECLSRHDYAERQPHIARALSGERQIFDIRRMSEDGQLRTWQVFYQPRWENDEIVGFFGVYQDVTERQLAEDRLKEAYETLEEKVASRTLELQVARADAEAATHSKTRFLAAASHDLLQPLSAARLLTSALAADMADQPQARRDLLDRVDQSIENADQLLRALLDITRLDARGVTPQLSRFSLDALILEVLGTLQDKAQAKGLTLRAVQSGVWVESDRGLMMSVLQNLLANAVRYTQRGGVVVGARRRGQKVALQVVDTGPGIPRAQRTIIFREFERGEGADARDRGLGLGLAIVDRILERLDHAITVQDGPDGGSVFAVELPRVAAEQLQPGGPSRRRTVSSLDGLSVLCLDNDEDVLTGLEHLLSRWGCQVVTARTQAEALQAFPQSAPDLAVIDFMLDDGDTGPSVYARLCDVWGKRPPAVLATAEREDRIMEMANAAGMEFIAKPVPPAGLRAVLTEMRSRIRRLVEDEGLGED